jgi:hypothetical protein
MVTYRLLQCHGFVTDSHRKRVEISDIAGVADRSYSLGFKGAITTQRRRSNEVVGEAGFEPSTLVPHEEKPH